MEDFVNVTDEEVKSLTHAILKRHGIDFTCYEPKSLRRRVIRAISVLGFKSIHEMWVHILQQPGAIYEFMDQISVGLTSMFRDPLLWTTLRKEIPRSYAGKNDLHIWHAGCSTGEEVFTMGMLLKEVSMLDQARTLATDISLDSIGAAKKGEYHKIRVLEFEKNYLEYSASGNFARYYERNDSMARFDQSLIRNVEFRYHNLISDHCSGSFDIIFCRNVMIYFDNAAKVKLMRKFRDVLKPGGLFVIGFYDALLPLVDESIFEVADTDAKIFRAK